MARDPYAGMNLAQPAPAPKLDQRLFAPTKSSPSEPAETAKRPLQRHEARPRPEGGAAAPERSPVVLSSLKASRFSLDDTPLYKNSFLFTQAEQGALDDLKLELRRELDAKVTKNDLVRCAVHMLVDDYGARGNSSLLCQRLQRRGGWRIGTDEASTERAAGEELQHPRTPR
jgi:hypothetical protein